MTDDIIPALTREQWTGVYDPGSDGSGPPFASQREWTIGKRGQIQLAEFDGDPEMRLLSVVQGSHAVGQRDQHALAALLLHGQPFGFTQQDVDRLQGAPDIYGGYGDKDRAAWGAFLESLTARIAALLPPPDVANSKTHA